MSVFDTLLYRPLFNLLIYINNLIPGGNIGIAIIILTVLTRLIIYPLTRQQIQGQKALQKLQPKLDAIRKKYKDDKQKQQEEIMKFYKEQKVNPLSSCLPLLVQLPILIALYRVFLSGLNNGFGEGVLYSFVILKNPINANFFGIILTEKNIALSIAAGLTQFFYSKLLTPNTKKIEGASKKTKTRQDDIMASMSSQMVYMFPIMTVIIGLQLPAGLMLYWITTTVFGIAQQYFVKDLKPKTENL